MPRFRLRAQVIRSLENINLGRQASHFFRSVVEDGDDSIEDMVDICYQDAEENVCGSRYLISRGTYRKRSRFFDWDDCVSDSSDRFNDEEFLQHFRLTRMGFHQMVEVIKENEVFKSPTR